MLAPCLWSWARAAGDIDSGTTTKREAVAWNSSTAGVRGTRTALIQRRRACISAAVETRFRRQPRLRPRRLQRPTWLRVSLKFTRREVTMNPLAQVHNIVSAVYPTILDPYSPPYWRITYRIIRVSDTFMTGKCKTDYNRVFFLGLPRFKRYYYPIFSRPYSTAALRRRPRHDRGETRKLGQTTMQHTTSKRKSALESWKRHSK